MGEKVIAIVLTRNRKKLFGECLGGLLKQSRRPEMVFVVDNASEDGTDSFFKEKYSKNKNFRYIRLKKNIGPSGGFYVGIKEAYKEGADWFWLMDDDSEPMKDCLKELLIAKRFLEDKKEKIGFLASCVYSPMGNIMNLSKVSSRFSEITEEQDYPQYLDKGLVKVENATFVSVLFSRDFISKKGYPIKEMFIWGDDTEYSYRASRDYPCYLVGKSKAIHKKSAGKLTTILTENRKEIIRLYYLYYRNNMYSLLRFESKMHLIRTFVNWITLKPLRCLLSPPYRFRKAAAVFFGTINGLFYNPKIEIPNKR